MDSLPQELIDKIITYLPSSDLRSSSLVARRWRRTSQQRAYYGISFSSERGVKAWDTFTQDGDHHEIMSYVRFLEFRNIRWKDPSLFRRTLMGLNSLSILWMTKTGIPGGVRDPTPWKGFGESVTSLCLESVRATSSAMMCMILSFPNLQELEIEGVVKGSKSTVPSQSPQPLAVPPVPSRQLNLLRLSGSLGGLMEALAGQLISRDLFLDIRNPGALQLLRFSSEIVVKLTLEDEHIKSFPSTDLPPFPHLTSIVFILTGESPSQNLMCIARSISAPEITSITFLHYAWNLIKPALFDLWDDVDEWLARTAKGAKIGDGFPLTLKRWPSNKLVRKRFLGKFREVGGQIKTVPQ